MAFQFRRGTEAERTEITPKPGEPLYVTDTGKVYIGDGTTEGGFLVNRELIDDLSPQLGGNLDLNGNNIVGTGDINITGTITATGDINLGDGVEDNVIVGGVIDSSLIPAEDDAYDLGDSAARWRQGWFEGLDVDGEISTGSLLVTNIAGPDSTSIYNGAEGEISVPVVTADSINAISINGDIKGSLFSEDSSIIVDAISNSFFTSSLEIESSRVRITNGIELQLEGKSLAVEWYNVDEDLDSAPRFLWKAARSNGDILAPVETNDTVGAIIGTIFDGSEIVPNSAISIVIDEKTGSYDYPSKYNLSLVNPEGELVDAFAINSSGTASANIFKTGSYANETERDTAIPNPEQGMIIFLLGHDDSTGTPKFQGYDGNSWVDFN